MLPNFLIVGAMKAGTTTLHHILAMHPDVFIAPREVHFFDRHHERGLGWYESQFAEAGGRALVGEKTPTYTNLATYPAIPGRIHAALPDVRLLWLFREPVARAYSHWWHAVRAGSETLPFVEAAALNDERLAASPNLAYLTRSDYAAQVRAYLALFPRDRMHFMLFEDLVRDERGTVEAACAFLGLDARRLALERTRANTSKGLGRIRARTIASLLRRKLAAILPLGRHSLSYDPLPDHARRELARRFEGPNSDLEDLTGLDLAFWRAP